mmetsp:Transcript_86868/g.254244  ORF Transcript_86868/g.254244 Transcript_86868/m.254244 type:complete len:241 (+) Transcript_86868:96-818(+)
MGLAGARHPEVRHAPGRPGLQGRGLGPDRGAQHTARPPHQRLRHRPRPPRRGLRHGPRVLGRRQLRHGRPDSRAARALRHGRVLPIRRRLVPRYDVRHPRRLHQRGHLRPRQHDLRHLGGRGLHHGALPPAAAREGLRGALQDGPQAGAGPPRQEVRYLRGPQRRRLELHAAVHAGLGGPVQVWPRGPPLEQPCGKAGLHPGPERAADSHRHSLLIRVGGVRRGAHHAQGLRDSAEQGWH